MPAFPTIPNAIITQNFNNYRPDLYGGDGRHKGIDYGIPAGTPVYACMSGLVELAAVANNGYGRHVVVKHGDGAHAYYAHLNSYSVAVGQPVVAGQQIGLSGGDPKDGVGGDGNSTGAHLHWEIRTPGNVAVDPYEYCLAYLDNDYREGVCNSEIGLNVRATPATDAKILYTLRHKQKVRVIHQTGDWSQLLSLRSEWCWSKFLDIEPGEDETAPDVMTLEDKVNKLWAAHPEVWG